MAATPSSATKANTSSPSARRKARRFLVQALYQWQISGSDLAQIEAEFRTDNDMSKVDLEYFHELLHGVPRDCSALDEKIKPFMDRDINDTTPIELAIMRLSSYELIHRLDVPYRVVINEAVELAKTFGSTDGHKYVNSIIDKLAQRERLVEIKGRGSST